MLKTTPHKQTINMNNNQQIEEYNERILFMLGNAYEYLYQTGKLKGYWEDLRGTALAGIALDYKELPNSTWIKLIKNNLKSNQITNGESIGSWNEEIWDTSMCVIALKSFEVSSRDNIIMNSIDWISELYRLNNRDNWHDEPWETCWALIAILTSGIIPEKIVIDDPINWLLDFQEDDGKIIAPHYTAYYLIIYKLLKKITLKEENIRKFKNSKDKALLYLKEILKNSEEIIWTGEAWANGQILWAISDLDKTFFEDKEILEKTISWFEQNQNKKGNWSDIEDTASAIIGLYKLLSNITEKSDLGKHKNIKNILQKRHPSPDVYIKKPLIERHPETGGLSIHFNNKTIKTTALIGVIGAGLATLFALIDFIKRLF